MYAFVPVCLRMYRCLGVVRINANICVRIGLYACVPVCKPAYRCVRVPPGVYAYVGSRTLVSLLIRLYLDVRVRTVVYAYGLVCTPTYAFLSVCKRTFG